MFKFLIKTFLIVTLCGSILMYGVFAYAPGTMEQSTLRAEVKKTLESVLGAKDVEVTGLVEFQLVPRFRVEFSGTKFTIPQEGGDKRYNLQSFAVNVNSWKALRGGLISDFVIKLDDVEYRGSLVADNFNALRARGRSKITAKMESPFELDVDATLSSFKKVFTVEEVRVTSDKIKGIFRGSQKIVYTENAQKVLYELKADFDLVDLNELFAIASMFAVENPEVKTDDTPIAGLVAGEVDKTAKTVKIIPFNDLWSVDKVDVSFLKQVMLDVEVKVDEIRFKNAVIKDSRITVNLEDEILKFDVNLSDFYDGAITLNSRVILENDVPDVTLDANVAKVNVGQLLADIDVPRKVVAVLDLNVDKMHVEGASERDMVATLGGEISVSSVDAAVDISDVAEGELKKILMYFVGVGNEVTFRKLASTFIFKQGEVFNDDFLADNSLSSIAGAGVFNLNTGQIKYNIDPKTLELAAGIGVKAPLKITGDIRFPEVSIRQMDAILQNIDQLGVLENEQVKKILGRSQTGKVKSTMDKVLGEGTADKMLKGLFGQ